MKPWLTLLLSVCSGAAQTQPAAPPVAVVELFTSEACAACLPAERLALSLDAGSAFGKSKSKGKAVSPQQARAQGAGPQQARTQGAASQQVEIIVLGEHVDYFNSEAWSDPTHRRCFRRASRTTAWPWDAP